MYHEPEFYSEGTYADLYPPVNPYEEKSPPPPKKNRAFRASAMCLFVIGLMSTSLLAGYVYGRQGEKIPHLPPKIEYRVSTPGPIPTLSDKNYVPGLTQYTRGDWWTDFSSGKITIVVFGSDPDRVATASILFMNAHPRFFLGCEQWCGPFDMTDPTGVLCEGQGPDLTWRLYDFSFAVPPAPTTTHYCNLLSAMWGRNE